MARKVLVLGATGIIGQYMQASEPAGLEVSYHLGRTAGDLNEWPRAWDENVIVNLAGESRVDVVEDDPAEFFSINVSLPYRLAHWCRTNGAHYVHVSSQAVFYGWGKCHAYDFMDNEPVNHYGRQKQMVDEFLQLYFRESSSIIRPSFILGLRKQPIGRVSPLEGMIRESVQQQVVDRWFSPCWAEDAAAALWAEALNPEPGTIKQIGSPERMSRFDIARLVNPSAVIQAVSQDDYVGAAPRPIDTTFSRPTGKTIEEGIREYLQVKV